MSKESESKRGRKSTFDQEKAVEILERLSAGEPLAVICRDEGMPKVRTVSDWKATHPDFAADFARAREEGADALAAECLEIADETSRDTITIHKKGADIEIPDKEWILRSKLRVETRLKLLAKWFPKRYGDKIEMEHGVTEGLAAVMERIRKRKGA